MPGPAVNGTKAVLRVTPCLFAIDKKKIDTLKDRDINGLQLVLTLLKKHQMIFGRDNPQLEAFSDLDGKIFSKVWY